MVQQSLIEYIQRLLQQGYDAGTIRTTLINAGYSPYDVDTAMRLAGGAPARRISTKALLIAFVVLLVLSGGVLMVLKITQAPPVVLGFSVSLFSTQVAPGQDLVVNAEIQNPGGKKTTGLIDYTVSGPSGKIASKTESFSVATQVSVPSSIAIPAGTAPGEYTVNAHLSYTGKSASQSVSFDVVEKPVQQVLPGEALKEKAEEAARAQQSTCPNGCDDLNFCTSDACVQGQCVNTKIEPCCGDGTCGAGESASSCVLDCSQHPIGPDELKKNAKELAVSDVAKAEEVCNSIGQRVYVDSCLSDVADASGNKEPCASVVDSDIRDACYIPFAYKNDFSVCAEITNPYMQNSCSSLQEMARVSGGSLPTQPPAQ